MNTLNFKNIKKVKRIKTSNNIRVIRTKTPNSQIINNKKHINFSSSNQELLALSKVNEKNQAFINCQNNIHSKSLKKFNYLQTSISPSNERNRASFKNKFFDILKSRSISKKKIDKFYNKIISNSKIKSKSISKGKQSSSKNKTNRNKKIIPMITNYNIKTKKLTQMTNSKESINSVSTSIYSNNLTEKEKTTLINIQNMLFNLISSSHNPKEILKEFELIHLRAISFSNSKGLSKNSYSEENYSNQFNQINLKFEEIEKENNLLKNLINEKITGFEDVKNSILNVQNEINKIKNNNEEDKLKKISNKSLPMKNVNMNVQNIKKINKIENLGNENLINENNSNDTIIQIQSPENIEENNNEMKLNFNGLDDNRKTFNDIFLSNYNQFSASWRNDIDKIMERRNENM